MAAVVLLTGGLLLTAGVGSGGVGLDKAVAASGPGKDGTTTTTRVRGAAETTTTPGPTTRAARTTRAASTARRAPTTMATEPLGRGPVPSGAGSPAQPWRQQSATGARWCRASSCSCLLLEHEPPMIEQLPLEADAIGADARGERQAEVGVGQPAREQFEFEQCLSEARLGKSRPPLADRLDVIEPATAARDQTEVWPGAL